jgi:HEAT repeat protein
MFGLFKPKCPVSLREKVWTELRLAWLADQFGLDRMLSSKVVVPTAEFFPDPYNASELAARGLLKRVCKLMEVDVARIDFRVRPETEMPDAAGLYEQGERPTISIEQSQLDDQESLIATLAHEVAHELLIGGKKLQGDEEDHEQITDLLMAFLGIGVFAANTRVTQTNSLYLRWESWSIKRLGYLTARTLGYSFAAIEWVSGHTNPAWAEFLGRDPWCAMRDGLRYLDKTDDTLFSEELGDKYIRQRSIDEVNADLSDDSDSVCVAAMWALEDLGKDAVNAIDSLVRCLEKRSAEVKREALLALGTIGKPVGTAISQIVDSMKSRDDESRAAATIAIGLICPELDMIGPHGASIQEELTILLDDSSQKVRHAAAGALMAYGPQTANLAPRLMPAFENALVHCEYEVIRYYTDVLMAIVPDVDPFLRHELAPRDPELYQLAVDILGEQRELQNDERGNGQS